MLRCAAIVAAPWLVLQCGDSSDLVIGSVTESNAVLPDAGGSTNAVTDADPDVPPASGSGGTGGGSGGSGGMSAAGAPAEVAGSGGDSGLTTIPCEVGDLPPVDSLIHRWDFSGPGLVAIDSMSGVNGDIINPDEQLDDGMVSFNGQGESYVNLEDGIVSVLTDATLIAWTTWNGGAAWQRVFDFGMNDKGEDMRGRGTNFFMLANMPSVTNASEFGFLQLEIHTPGGDDEITTEDFPKDVEHQYAVSVRDGVQIDLYIDGQLAGATLTDALLAEVDDRNAWFGLSQTASDVSYNGIFNEFRIYNVALSGCAVDSLYQAGPDVIP